MTEQHRAPTNLPPDAVVPPEGGLSKWMTLLTFAGVMMTMLGAFNIVAALVALTDPQKYSVAEDALLVFDYTTWGWLWFIFGVVVLFAGFGVLAGQTWARAVGVAVVALNAIAHLSFVAATPFWSTLIIAFDVVVIYALTVHGVELGQDYSRR